MAGSNYSELNDTIRYTMWSVFRVRPGVLPEDRAPAGVEAQEYLEALAGKGVIVRGVYHVGGLRADADFMIWWHSGEIEALQSAYADFRRNTALGRASEPVWSNVGLHRAAEFNKAHVPAFLEGKDPLGYLCVYPFVRAHEWYLLPEEERREMLSGHGKAAREYPDVQANTVSAFALGNYEWLLAFESDELHRIVDLMRHMRTTEARRYVREETPFYSGARTPVAELVQHLP